MRLSFVTENTVDVASDVNQSLLEADGLIVSRVTGIETAPPAVLIDGLRVAIASGATGAFAGKAGQLGVYVENGAFWQFYSPALCVFDGVTYLSAGGDWIQSSGGAAGEEFTLAEKQKLSDIASEATKNRADSENADKVHTHTMAQVTGLDTALSGKASNTDPRFTDAREWTATTISQAEVESGTATTRRAFTAQRLRQAITAWFTGISGAIGRTILGRSTAAEVRGDLGLGTAATTNNGVGFGQNIINSAVSGDGNISYSGTLLNNTTGFSSTAAGWNALAGNTTGSNNTAAGRNALLQNTTGGNNTAVGRDALAGSTTGDNNTAVGLYALQNTTGGNNTASGANALRHNLEYSNCGGFGYDSSVTASNQIQLGDAATTVYAYGAVQSRSDARDKTEVRDTALGLDFINAIRPVDYKLDMREDYRVVLGEHPTEEQLEANKLANIQADGTHTRKRYHHGVIAQEVATVIDTLGIDFGGFQDHSKIGGDDVLSIGYEEFIAPLIKAVQELSARVKVLEGKAEDEELDDEAITRNQE